MRKILSDQQNLKGVIWMLLWTMTFSCSMTMVKFIGHDIPVIIKISTRLVFGLMFISPFILQSSVQKLKTERLPFHFMRTLLMLGSMCCTYYAYTHLPLAFATSIGFTAPLMTTLLASLILKERVESRRWIAMIFGYTGVLIMVRPGIVDIEPAVLVALMANLLASTAVITVKQLTRTESTLQIMFYFNVISVLITTCISYFFWKSPSVHQLILLGVLGATGIFSQFCTVNAYRYSQPSFLAPIEYLRLVIAIPIGMIVLKRFQICGH